MDKNLIGRFVPKGDFEANWKKAVNFIPLDKEIIIYKPDKDYSYARMKIGDGKTGVNDLPFVVDVNGDIASKEWVEKQAQALGLSLQEYVNSSVQGFATEEYVDNAIIEVIQPIENKNNEQDDKIAELEDRVTIATFKITEEDIANGTNIITLKNLEGMTKIDWGDGVVNGELSHIYATANEYLCKIYDMTIIGYSAFKNCFQLTNIIFSSIITEIRSTAFKSTGVIDIILPDNITTLGYDAFYHCTNLTNVKIGNGIVTISRRAFAFCDNLINVFIGKSVISFNGFPFQNCDLLTEITIPKNVMIAKGNTFIGCNNLTKIVCEHTVPPDQFEMVWIADHFPTNLKIYVPYGCGQAYKNAWPHYADIIMESDREANMSDVNALKSEIQEQLVGKTDYLGTVAAMTDLSTIAGAGDYHRVSTEFVYDESTGEVAHVGDILIAVIDLVGLVNTQTKEYWDLVHTELGAAPATQEDINSIFEEA